MEHFIKTRYALNIAYSEPRFYVEGSRDQKFTDQVVHYNFLDKNFKNGEVIIVIFNDMRLFYSQPRSHAGVLTSFFKTPLKNPPCGLHKWQHHFSCSLRSPEHI